jgi:hypothetical protein
MQESKMAVFNSTESAPIALGNVASATVAKLQAAHPNLVPISAKNDALVAAAKNIRKELAAAFAGVKFSVKSSRYSGGDSIDISWVDGPTTAQVDEIADKYQGGDFNGMDDSYTYRRNDWIRTFGDAKYVHAQRSYSDRWVMAVMYRVGKRLGGLPHVPTLEDFRKGRLWNFMTSGGCDYGREVNIALSESTAFPASVTH